MLGYSATQQPQCTGTLNLLVISNSYLNPVVATVRRPEKLCLVSNAQRNWLDEPVYAFPLQAKIRLMTYSPNNALIIQSDGP